MNTEAVTRSLWPFARHLQKRGVAGSGHLLVNRLKTLRM
jgi:hypothetical protein